MDAGAVVECANRPPPFSIAAICRVAADISRGLLGDASGAVGLDRGDGREHEKIELHLE